jgi:hypothetical protein
MSFLTIRSLSARPRRRLVLGRDGDLGPISPNEIEFQGLTAPAPFSDDAQGRL